MPSPKMNPSGEKRVLIMGAGGRDFHVFLTTMKDDPSVRVVTITATQIPFIENRTFPASLAGPRYPNGIPICDESELTDRIRKEKVDLVVFAYSDVKLTTIEEKRKIVTDAGAKFTTFDVHKTMIPSVKPVIAVCAVRTGCGKSAASRYVLKHLKERGLKSAAIRHPMPYGDLAKQAVQRFETFADLDAAECTIEEREEYEPHLMAGSIVFAGVDYRAILRRAEEECDVILWDGGNNDTPFYKPDLWITLADPLRAGHELTHFPSRENFEGADVILISKADSATEEGKAQIRANAKKLNPDAQVLEAKMPVTLPPANAAKVKGKRVLVVEDGPTVTHGGMKTGAGTIAATRYGAKELIDPRPFVKGLLKETFANYPGIGRLLPAMGYSREQIHDLESTINACDADLVVIGTPIDLGRLVKVNKPAVWARYDLECVGKPDLGDAVDALLARKR